LGDPDFVEKLMNRFSERQIQIAEVEEILLDNKKSDYFLTIPWDTLTEFEDDIETGEQAHGEQRLTCPEFE
jgi:hypothetical protein